MSYSRRESIQIIEKLTALTQHGKLNWQEVQPDRRMNDSISEVDIVYLTTYEGHDIRVYLRNYKSFFEDEHTYNWEESVEVELLNSTGRVIFKFPSISNKYELLNAIEVQDTQVKSFFDKFL
ncbi:hypothetical protein D9M71_36780 [compost metagenome]